MHKPPFIDSREALQSWFLRSGVTGPLLTCMGPLPQSKASIARWARDTPDPAIQTVSPHPDSYRIAVMLEPLESQIWVGDQPIWGGMIAANRFRICPPGAASRWRSLSGCDIVNIFIPTATVDRFSLMGGLPDSYTLAGNLFTPDRQVLDLVWKMLDAKTLAGPLAEHFCDGLITALLSYLLEHYGQGSSAECRPSSLGGSRLRRVLALIHERAGEDLSIAEMAAQCAMSESHFSREFRSAVGMPPHQYMMKLRLEQACAALLDSDARIVDIALDFGFHSASHFSRAFAARYGMPPANYRRLQASRAQD